MQKEMNSLMKRLTALPTGNICDALAEMGRAPRVMRGIKSIGHPGSFAGPAFTLRQIPRPLDASPNENLTGHAQAFDDLAKPGQVLVIDTGGRDEVCTFGSILIFRAKLRGLAGVVTDGAARDVDEIPHLGLPVHVKSANPIASKGFFQTVSLGEPVSCGGVHVRPGDIVCGDATGILIIPPTLMQEVVDCAETIHQKETKWMTGLRQGKSLYQVRREA